MALDTTIKNDTLSQGVAASATPAAPLVTVGGTNIQPQTTQQAKPSTGGLDMSQFASIVDTMRSKLAENNKLVDTRTKLLNTLYNRPLTADELGTLDPSTQELVRAGDKSQIEMQIRILNDRLSGRTQSLDKSVDFLTNAYEKTLLANEKAKSDALAFVSVALNNAKDSGVSPKAYMEQLYGTDKLAQLEDLTGLEFRETGVAPKKDKGFTPYQLFTATQNLKKTTTKNTEAARELQRQKGILDSTWNRLESGEAKDLNATSQAIVTTFNKILDPLSVVREAEYDRTSQGQALIEAIQGKLAAIKVGGPGLTKASLKELVDLGDQYARNATNFINDTQANARAEAEFFGLNPDFVVGPSAYKVDTKTTDDFKSKIISASNEDTYKKIKSKNPGVSDEEIYNELKSKGRI